MIENGEYDFITELAEAEKINQSYACRVLRLTLLAPSIVADILDARTNSGLMIKRLMRPFPAQWHAQSLFLRTEGGRRAYQCSRAGCLSWFDRERWGQSTLATTTSRFT